jgi:hypothetical protein
MKKLLSILLLFIVTISYSQSKTTKDTIYNDGKQLFKQVYNDAKTLTPKIEAAITSLATSLKTSANNVWEIIVKQQVVWSWCFLILTLVSLLNWCVFYKKLYPSTKDIEFTVLIRDVIDKVPNGKFDAYYEGRDDYKNDMRSKRFTYTKTGTEEYNAPKLIDEKETTFKKSVKLLHLTSCVTLSVFSFYHFSDMLTGFLNPEFGALKTIVEVAKQLK